MGKKDRLRRIAEIIATQDIETQEDLLRILRSEGYDVTQATISRDIRELRLTKSHVPGGGQKYVALKESTPEAGSKYMRVMRDGIVSMDQAQNILVIHTASGMAMGVAAAVDELHFPEVVGCIAGDDTIFAAVRSAEETAAVIARIREIVAG